MISFLLTSVCYVAVLVGIVLAFQFGLPTLISDVWDIVCEAALAMIVFVIPVIMIGITGHAIFVLLSSLGRCL